MCIWRQTKTRLVQLEALLLRCCCPSAIVSSKSTRKKSLTDTKHNTRDKTTKKTDTRQTTPRRLIIHTSPTFFSLSSMQTTIRRLDETDSELGFAFRGEHFRSRERPRSFCIASLCKLQNFWKVRRQVKNACSFGLTWAVIEQDPGSFRNFNTIPWLLLGHFDKVVLTPAGSNFWTQPHRQSKHTQPPP